MEVLDGGSSKLPDFLPIQNMGFVKVTWFGDVVAEIADVSNLIMLGTVGADVDKDEAVVFSCISSGLNFCVGDIKVIWPGDSSLDLDD